MKSVYSYEEVKEQCEKIYKKWPDPSVFEAIPYIPTLSTEEMLLEPEDIEGTNLLVYNESITNAVEIDEKLYITLTDSPV